MAKSTIQELQQEMRAEMWPVLVKQGPRFIRKLATILSSKKATEKERICAMETMRSIYQTAVAPRENEQEGGGSVNITIQHQRPGEIDVTPGQPLKGLIIDESESE